MQAENNLDVDSKQDEANSKEEIVDPEETCLLCHSSMSSKILYEELGPEEIRVLYIDKGTGSHLRGTLQTISLRRQTSVIGWLKSFWNQFEALSYHWGDDTKTHSIQCNGFELEIHSNLYQALDKFRQLRPGVPIWTDGICINQLDPKEKRAQIRMMGRIYSRARQVFAYLGEPPLGMKDLMKHVPEICRQSKQIASIDTRTQSHLPENWHKFKSAWHQAPKLPPSGSQIWQTLKALLSREYFNRLWILQEVALARRVTFVVGTHQLSWAQMELLSGAALKLQTMGELLPLGTSYNNSAFLIRDTIHPFGFGLVNKLLMWVLRRMLTAGEQASGEYKLMLRELGVYDLQNNLWKHLRSSNLEDLISYSRRQDCKLPEDRILGITGMIQTLLDKEDYPWLRESISAGDMYLEAFYFLAINDISLKMLRMAPPHPQNGLSLPSWCPDFSRKAAGLHQAGFSGRPLMPWQASKLEQKVSRGLDIRKLKLFGVRVSEVCFVSGGWKALNIADRSQTADELQAKVSENTAWLKKCSNRVPQPEGESTEGQFRSSMDFWRTLVAGRTNMIGFTDLCLEDFRRLENFLERASSPTSSFWQEVQIASTKREAHGASDRPPEKSVLTLIDFESRDKVFFVTRDGKFGLAYDYPGVITGDTLCVFHGAKVPHLLRRQPDFKSWAFVGEVYVDNLTQGEAEAAVDGKLPESESFVLV